MEQPFTLQGLLTVAGATMFTQQMVAFLKSAFPGITGRWTHLATFAVAELVLVGGGILAGAKTPQEIALLAANALYIYFAAIGENENVSKQRIQAQ